MEPTLHSFGGSAMDRHIFDFETVADGSAATAGAPAGDGPSPTADPAADPAAVGGEPDPSSAGATDVAPALAPEYLTAEDAAAIADARFSQLLEQARGGQPAPTQGGDGGQVDLNQFLDPYGDNFGNNLASVLGGMLQQITTGIDQRFQPFSEQAEQTQRAELDTVLQTAVNDHAGAVGGLRGGDAAVQRVMADVRNRYMPEAVRLYGNSDRAAQIAIDKAVRAEQSYQREIAGGAAVESAEHLALLDGGRSDIAGGGAAVVTFPDKPLSQAERVAKYGRLAAATQR